MECKRGNKKGDGGVERLIYETDFFRVEWQRWCLIIGSLIVAIIFMGLKAGSQAFFSTAWLRLPGVIPVLAIGAAMGAVYLIWRWGVTREKEK